MLSWCLVSFRVNQSASIASKRPNFINISASMRVKGIISRCGHRDARLSKIRTQARLGVKGVWALQTDLSSIFRRSGLRFPFVSLVLFADCSRDGWLIIDLARRRKSSQAYFDRAPSPAHKPVWSWGTFGLNVSNASWMYRRGIEGPSLSLMSWIGKERIAVRENLPHHTLWLCE